MSQYANVVSPQHEDFETKDSGLVINPSYPHLGASPDGFVSCRCTLEIKYPYCVKNQSPETEGDDAHLKETYYASHMITVKDQVAVAKYQVAFYLFIG